ncbi:hypothetical protein [Methylophaga sp.]|uniref:hypothetical protein n=1 Tax=Methylophaga sp. TaxID=2024840 RepID=UPI003A8F1232
MSSGKVVDEKRAVSIYLGLGIFFIPIIFSWFTLRRGYSSLAQVVSFSWLVILFGIIGAKDVTENNSVYQAEYTTSYQLTEDVGIELEAKIQNSGGVRLVGTTNLPEGTVLMGSISAPDNGYFAQDKLRVVGSKFESAVFSNKGMPLSNGIYIAKIVMPLPKLQSDSVKSIIGVSGEYLSGPLVEKDELGVSVSKLTKFIIDTAEE